MSTTGKYLSAQANGGNLVKGANEWSSEDTGEPELDATDAESNGYTDTDVGPVGVRIRIRGIWDLAADGPFPDIRKGVTLVNAAFYGNRNQATPDFLLPSALVVGCTKQISVRDKVTYDITVVNKGRYQQNGVDANIGL